jgi:hypothetical protein
MLNRELEEYSYKCNKSATVETGATVSVPLFINEGDKIKMILHQVLIWNV